MNVHSNNPSGGNSQSLAFNGISVATKGEFISLTDLWKAAGSPKNKEPFNWARFEGEAFIEAVAFTHNLSVAQVMITKQGKGGGTNGHWQISLAYAKYLSPEFHMQCNALIREHMEGRPPQINIDTGAFGRQVAAIVDDKLDIAIRQILPPMIEKHMAADPRVAALEYVSVRELLNEAKALSKGRNRLNRRIGHALRDLAMTANPPAALRRCPHSNVWLFPRGFAAKFMASTGNAWVSAHNDGVTGQGSLRLVRRTDEQGVPA